MEIVGVFNLVAILTGIACLMAAVSVWVLRRTDSLTSVVPVATVLGIRPQRVAEHVGPVHGSLSGVSTGHTRAPPTLGFRTTRFSPAGLRARAAANR